MKTIRFTRSARICNEVLEPLATVWFRVARAIIDVMLPTFSCIQCVVEPKILHEMSNALIDQ